MGGFKIYVMNGSLVQWRGGGKKHAAKSMQGLRGVAEIAANIKKRIHEFGHLEKSSEVGVAV
jgi:hypothetical protein